MLRTRILGMALCWLPMQVLLACASIDVPMPENPTAAIAQAGTLLDQQQPEAAMAVLTHFDEDAFTGAEQARRTVLMGKAYYLTGDSWEAYKQIKSFSQDYPSSPTDEVADVQLNAGLQLLKSDGGFLFFYSDKKRGRVVLEDFLIYYQYSARIPDVLHELAESAFRDQDYILANERYTQLITNHNSSEWVTLARFRVAMCYFYGLEGPDYDLEGMTRARNELRDVLATPNENPKMVGQAQQALYLVQEWLGQKHVIIAHFYNTINNRAGMLHHLRIAATSYADTAAGKLARQRLARMEKAEKTEETEADAR